MTFMTELDWSFEQITFGRKIVNVFFSIKLKIILGAQKSRLTETALLSTRTMFWLFICFVALRPKSTGKAVHLATLFPG